MSLKQERFWVQASYPEFLDDSHPVYSSKIFKKRSPGKGVAACGFSLG